MTLYAKSADARGNRETLLDHLLRVAEMIRQLYDRLPISPRESDSSLPADLQTAAAVHDLGKAATGFQAMILGERPDWQGRRHEVVSASFVAALGAAEELTFAVLTHHKRIPDFPPIEPQGRLRFFDGLPEDWEETLRQFEANRSAAEQLWTELAGLLGRPDFLCGMANPLSGDFLSSAWRRPDRQRTLISTAVRRRASLIRGLLISADHLASAGVALPPVVDLKLFRPKFILRPFQQRSAIPGNLILKAPTGSGKTEAALTWAACNQPDNGRFFYTLPYTAALNAMHSRMLREFPASPASIGLLHGRAAHHLFDAMQREFPGNPSAATKEALGRAGLAREMYHSVRVCTPHQLLRYTLRGRGWEQILTEIPGSCVVFDEVHSYDPGLAGLTLGTARLFHQLGANLMFISATLPKFLERLIADIIPCQVLFPDSQLEGDREIMGRRRHTVTVDERSLKELLPSIISSAKSGSTVLVVCNHVRSAQSMAAYLRAELGESAVCLFHGRFNMRDRAEIERKLAAEKLPVVLVATQVVEVSLDISYDLGYFEAAPIDALAQRMGRVNRRGDRPPAPIIVAARALNHHQLYDSALTARTLELLRSCVGPISEQDLATICDQVYAEGYQGEDKLKFNENLEHPYFTGFEESMIAGDHENWTERVLKVEGRVDVLPLTLLAEYDQLSQDRRWIEADALTVNIHMSRRLESDLDKDHEPWVIRRPYTAQGLEL